LNFCAVAPIQYALADYMANHPEHIDALPDFYQAKRDQLCQALAGSRFTFQPSRSTYFQLIDYSAIREDLDDVAMARWLTEHKGIATIPLSAFYQSPPVAQRLLRVCFAKQASTLAQAGDLLAAI
ncbi:MAG: aminotransferase class I/II-fold pyridoxal phosphate-dependent enzyme, partial [Neisseriaceae bacterium]|nr:aminotransferase class I/II-fold pyridoxal phosphate-dependent enzyme [Neisseriaceae bacterium]